MNSSLQSFSTKRKRRRGNCYCGRENCMFSRLSERTSCHGGKPICHRATIQVVCTEFSPSDTSEHYSSAQWNSVGNEHMACQPVNLKENHRRYFGSLHCKDHSLVSGLNKLLSPVMTLNMKFGSSLACWWRSSQTLTWCCFCSQVRKSQMRTYQRSQNRCNSGADVDHGMQLEISARKFSAG